MSKSLKGLTAVLFLSVLGLLCSACNPPGNVGPTLEIQSGNRNIRYGMPAKATKEETNKEAYLIERPQYVLSYNEMKKNPNWVSWNLIKQDLDHADRGPFKPDPLLPKSFVHVTEGPYTGTGFDRGHMCPSADRSASQDDNDATFYMTNIIPQAPSVNRKGWERMESYCRSLTKQGKDLHICCGPAGTGGEGSKGKADHIGSGKTIINVPAQCWKVVMVLPKGEQPTQATRTFAVLMPNSEDVDINWPKYRVSVKKVEETTGLHFWPNLSKEVGDAIKGKLDNTDIHVEPYKAH